MRISGIYAIAASNRLTSCYYIGQSVNVSSRLNEHLSALTRKTHPNRKLQSIWNKRRGNIKCHILEVCNTQILAEREQYWIDKLRPTTNIMPAINFRCGNRAKIPIPRLECPTCRKKFRQQYADHKFCSGRCRIRFNAVSNLKPKQKRPSYIIWNVTQHEIDVWCRNQIDTVRTIELLNYNAIT